MISDRREEKTTHCYDALNYYGFDKVINPEKISLGLQAVFELQNKYELDRE